MEELSFLEAEDVGSLTTESTEEPTAETAEETTTEPSTEPSTEPTEQKYKVKVNKKEKELTLDELIANAQKGMDYDRIREDRDKIKPIYEKSKKAIELLERKAKEANMPLEQYAAFIEQADKQQEIDSYKQQLIDKGVDEDTASEIANIKFENGSLKSTVDNLSQQTRAQEEQQAKVQRDIEEFARMFPDVQEFPPDVIQDINSGMNPVTAYLKFQNDVKDKELAALRQNAKNKEIDTGSVQTQKDTEQDPFVAGLLGK